MKKILSLLFATASLSTGFTQTATLSKGKQIIIVTSLDQNIDMGMQMTTKSTSTNKVAVISVDSKNYTVSNTVDKFLFNGNMMGKEIKYDSEKKEDRDSEEGKQFGALVGKTDTVLIDIATGVAADNKKKSTSEVTEAENPMAGMMGGMSEGNAAIAGSIIFKIPAPIKKGNTWKDSTDIKGMKANTTFVIEEITNGVATVTSKGTVKGTATMEAQGNSMDMTMDTKTDGKIWVDIKTNLVKKRTNVADISGSIEVGGQSMPFTSKTTTESTYQ